jgi:hypothetical protein
MGEENDSWMRLPIVQRHKTTMGNVTSEIIYINYEIKQVTRKNKLS